MTVLRPRRRALLPAVLATAAHGGALLAAYLLASRLTRRGPAPAGGPAREDAVALPPPDPLPGRPRLVLPVGGTAQAGDPAAQGVEREVLLSPGRSVLGAGPQVDVRLEGEQVAPAHAELETDADAVRLRDLTGTGRVLVDGVPVLDAELVDGNRVSVAGHDVTFRRDTDFPAPGRQGGEGS